MNSATPAPEHWNIFARELEKVLKKSGKTFNDLIKMRIVYYPQYIQRLEDSRISSRHLHTLNADAVGRLFVALSLNETEKNRIRASLIATETERLVLNRMDPYIPYAALMAADDVYRVLNTALNAHQAPDLERAGFRAATALNTLAYDQAVDLIEGAMLSLNFRDKAADPAATSALAQKAYNDLTRALALLDEAKIQIEYQQQDQPDEWLFWRDEAIRGRDQSEKLARGEMEAQ